MTPVLLLRATIWLSVFAWAGAEVLKRRPARARAARVCWTIGALLLAAHTAIAFAYWHGWSHDAAYAATALQSEALTGVAAGWGLYLNYAFVLIWMADAVWWWRSPERYAARPRSLELAILAFFVFMMVNGAIVFAPWPMRAAGIASVAIVLGARALDRALPRGVNRSIVSR